MLIVGTGPVGLLLALHLVQSGTRVVIVDRQPSRYPLPRAVCLDNESQRNLWATGLAEQLKPILESIIVRLPQLSCAPALSSTTHRDRRRPTLHGATLKAR